jgi:MoaA/NifB/PqqE/SkfB family radical SAM enzyme
MSLETYRKSLAVANDHCEFITIGGGEPTLHREFRTMLIEAIADIEERVHIVTNGSVKRHALLLAKLDKRGVIDAELSDDAYHDDVDCEVYDAFEKKRDVTQGGRRKPIGAGRAVTELGIEWDEGQCACSSHIVKPNGTIRQCGCPDAPIVGNVDDGIECYVSECCRSEEYREQLRELYA